MENINPEDLNRIDIIESSSPCPKHTCHTEQQRRRYQGEQAGVTAEWNNNNNLQHISNATQKQNVAGLAEATSRRLSALSFMETRFDSSKDIQLRGSPRNMVRRWSQQLSHFSKNRWSIPENTIFRMPSRKVFEVNGILQTNTGADANTEIKQLVQEIEQYEQLMQNTTTSEQNRLSTLRTLPLPLATKCLIKQKLNFSIERHTVNQKTDQCAWNYYNCLCNVCTHACLQLWSLLCLICKKCQIWTNTLKIIEGHFGSNVSSYFNLLRCFLMLNSLLLLCMGSFVILPQIFYNINAAVAGNETLTAKNISNANLWYRWKIVDLITGSGYLSDSLLYYGSYKNITLTLFSDQHKYSLPYAYYMTILVLYLQTFVVISICMARCYRVSFIEVSVVTRSSSCARKLFCFWDFHITSRQAAKQKHFAIFNELKQVLCLLRENEAKLSILWRMRIYCVHNIAHLLVLVLIAGFVFGIWLLLKKFDAAAEDVVNPWSSFYVALFINISLLFLQMIFKWIVK